MDKISFLPFFLQSFPESFVLLFVGFVFTGTKINYKNLVIFAIITTTFSYIIRSSQIVFGVHTLLQFVLMCGLLIFFERKDSFRSILIVTCGVMTVFIAELSFMLFLIYIIKLPIENFLANDWLRIFLGLPYTTVLLLIAIYMKRKNIVILKFDFDGLINKINIDKKTTLFTILILVEGIFLILLASTLVIQLTGTFFTINLNLLLILIFITALVFNITTVIIVMTIQKLVIKETKMKLELENLKELQKVYQSISHKRHDFLNHVASLYGLIRTKCIDEAEDYISSIFSDLVKEKNIINLGIPALSGLLQTKKDIAKEKDIDLKIKIDPTFQKIDLSSIELTSIIGNLLDNAIDAVEEVDEGRLIKLQLIKSGDIYKINIYNLAKNLPAGIEKNLCAEGFTTKSKESHFGLGMSAVQKIVKEHQGNISVIREKDPEALQICISIPTREESGV